MANNTHGKGSQLPESEKMKLNKWLTICLWAVLSIFLCVESYADSYKGSVPLDADTTFIEYSDSDISPFDFPHITIKQVSLESRKNRQLHVSQNGLATWVGTDKGLHDVFLYDGKETKNITKTKRQLAFHPHVNSLGHVTYNDFWGNIYFYNGIWNTRVPEDGVKYSRKPIINDEDKISWLGSEFRLFDDNKITDVFIYDQKNVEQLTEGKYFNKKHQMNNSGHMVWQGKTENSWEIFYYDGNSVTQLTNNNYRDVHPQINDNGEIVWSGFDGEDLEIFYYDGNTVQQITDNNIMDRRPKINNSGEIVWVGIHEKIKKYKYKRKYKVKKKRRIRYKPKLTSAEIYLYSSGTIKRLTDNKHVDVNPDISDNGTVVWESYPERHLRKNAEIYIYDGFDSYRLTKNNVPDIRPQIGDEFVFWNKKRHGFNAIYMAHIPLKSDYVINVEDLSLCMELDVDFSDTSGHHQPVVSGPFIDNSEFMVGSGSALFDGSDDRVFIISNTANGFMDIFDNLTDNVTVSFWVRHNGLNGLESYMVRGGSVFDTLGANRWGMAHDEGNGLRFVMSNGQSIDETIAAGQITDSQWHHWALVRVQDQFGIYLDGQLIYYLHLTSTMATSSDFRIGYENVQYYFNGHMDDIIITRSNPFSALPDAELTDSFLPPENGFVVINNSESPTGGDSNDDD